MTDLAGFSEALLTGSDYNPYLARIRFHPYLGWYLMLGSPRAFDFIQLAYGKDGVVDSADTLLDNPWPLHTCRAFLELGPQDRSDVMAFVSVTLHELIHNGDLLTTPTGAVFHTKLSAAVRPLDDVTRWINDDPGFDCGPPARRWRPSDPAHRSIVGDLLISDEFFRLMRKVQPTDIRPGWGQDVTAPAPLLGRGFSPVTIYDSVRSMVIPGHADWYVTPGTILEGRALAACLLRLLNLFDGIEPARVLKEIRLFLRTYYPRTTTSPNYYCLLDGAARAIGVADLEDALVGGCRLEHVAQVPRLALAVGWWALHGADPVDGAVLGLSFLHEASDLRRLIAEPEDVCDQIEAWAGRGPRLRQRAEHASLLVDQAVELLRDPKCDASVKIHFEHVFRVLRRYLANRAVNGWRFPLSSPPRGTPFPYFDPQQKKDLGGTYVCPKRFEDWVQLREEICHRFRTAQWKRDLAHRWHSGQKLFAE
jgi:hypothetical protein